MNKQHGALIWGMRLQDLHEGMHAKNDTWAPLGVVEGPTEPTRLDGIFESLEEFFLAHDPGALLAYSGEYALYGSCTYLFKAGPLAQERVVVPVRTPLPYLLVLVK